MNDAASTLPLDGVRVLDLGQFIAMPFCALWLAWLGAEVIVVESRRRMTSRTAPPFKPGLEGNPDGSGYFNQICSSKKSCTLDMTTAAGRDIVRRLAGKVDVMVDNFSTGVLEKLGLGYDVVGKLNPGHHHGVLRRVRPLRPDEKLPRPAQRGQPVQRRRRCDRLSRRRAAHPRRRAARSAERHLRHVRHHGGAASSQQDRAGPVHRSCHVRGDDDAHSRGGHRSDSQRCRSEARRQSRQAQSAARHLSVPRRRTPGSRSA